MREIEAVRQVAGEPRRRWFSDEEFDLIVWIDDAGEMLGFQLCYDREGQPRAITWRRQGGFRHEGIDDGDSWPRAHKATPVLVADGPFDAPRVVARLRLASAAVPESLRGPVLARLAELESSG